MNSIQDNIKLFIFNKRDFFLKWLRFAINLVSIAVLTLMVIRYGFNYEEDFRQLWLTVIRVFYSIYFINYILRLVLHKNKWSFINVNWFETILMLMIMFNGINYFILQNPQLEKFFRIEGTEGTGVLYDFFIQFFLLILAFIELVKSINIISSSKIKPATLFLLSYFALICIGTIILVLPGFNLKGEYLDFFDALFISSSASCITGLATVNVVETFNLKGQVIILLLFQLGGIGIVTFASFFASFVKKGLGIRQQVMMNEMFMTDANPDSQSMLKRILVLMFSIEFIGAFGLYFLWGDYQFESNEQQIFYSIFHSVSAFCNAGFSLFPKGFETTGINNQYIMLWFTTAICFFGALGFPAIRDMISPTRLRERLDKPWKDWKLGTKVAVYSSILFTIAGTVLYYFLHVHNLDEHSHGLGKLTIALFTSVNLRSCGLSTIDISTISHPLVMFSLFFMFVGGASGSTGGGIKTSTFVVAFAAIIGNIRGKREITMGRRTIGTDLIYKSFAIILFSGNYILLSTTILTFTEDPSIPFLNLVYESISAFANVGSSMGVTSQLTDFGKTLLSFSMFFGRVGLLTFAFSLSSRHKADTLRYPPTQIMIG
jgi:trk system potassium uptake protein